MQVVISWKPNDEDIRAKMEAIGRALPDAIMDMAGLEEVYIHDTFADFIRSNGTDTYDFVRDGATVKLRHGYFTQHERGERL